MTRLRRAGLRLGPLLVAVALGCGGGGETSSGGYPDSIDEASSDARDASVDFRVSEAVIDGPADDVQDEKDLDRLDAPLTAWSAEVTELAAELEGVDPPADAAEGHSALLSAVRDKQAALERVEGAVDDRDVDAFEEALAATREADEQDEEAQAELDAAGHPVPFAGPTTEIPPADSRDLVRQADREYEVAVDNEAGPVGEAGERSVAAQERLPEDEALAADPSPLRGIAGPFDREARESDAAADGLETVTPPEGAEDLHSELVAAQRERAAAASDVAAAAKRRDLKEYQRAGQRYERAADRQQDAVTALDDAGYGFVAYGSASDELAEDEQHVARTR